MVGYSNTDVLERIVGCFKGLTTGDAVGKQTESLKYEEIKEWFPQGIHGFHGTINSVMPRYDGKHYLWKFGETTDDSEQTTSIARVIAQGAPLNHTSVGKELMLCKKPPDIIAWQIPTNRGPFASGI